MRIIIALALLASSAQAYTTNPEGNVYKIPDRADWQACVLSGGRVTYGPWRFVTEPNGATALVRGKRCEKASAGQ